MKLSVVIPVYNEIHTIDSTLTEVIKALPRVDKEIIIVDDGSTDGTREWLSRIVQTHTSIAFMTLNAERELMAVQQCSELANQLQIDQLQIDQLQIDQLQSDQLQSDQSKIDLSKIDPPQTAVDTALSPNVLPVAVKVILHDRNQGKGAALRTGFAAATGDVFVIQDADLEYNPHDWERMWQLIANGRADVVYGSRFYGEPHRVLYFHHLLGNKVITTLTNLLCNTTFTDIEVCYKMFRCEVLRELRLICNDFGFEVEFTVKMSRSPRRWRLYESGISYYGRTYEEGKKINWRDGLKALWYIVRFRFAN